MRFNLKSHIKMYLSYAMMALFDEGNVTEALYYNTEAYSFDFDRNCRIGLFVSEMFSTEVLPHHAKDVEEMFIDLYGGEDTIPDHIEKNAPHYAELAIALLDYDLSEFQNFERVDAHRREVLARTEHLIQAFIDDQYNSNDPATRKACAISLLLEAQRYAPIYCMMSYHI